MSGPCVDDVLITAANIAADILKQRELTVVTAESCTAGLISAALSYVEGASDVLHGSFVVYTKAQKIRALRVPSDLLERRGSVCDAVAGRMACGALEHSEADIALAVTGVLGPNPDEDGNPVGLVYFAVCRRKQQPIITEKRYERMEPDEMRSRVAQDALELLGRVGSTS